MLPRQAQIAVDPVVVRTTVYNTATTLSDDDDENDLARFAYARPATMSGLGMTEARKRLLMYGVPALLLGALGNAVVAGLAFRSYKRTKSALRPAVIIGVGGLAISGLTLLAVMRTLEPVVAIADDDRLAAVGMGLLLGK